MFLKVLNVIGNISTVALCCFMAYSYVTEQRPSASPRVDVLITDNDKQLLNIGTHGKTILLALSPNCRFCTISAPFYRELRLKTKGKVTFSVIMPSNEEIASRYMSRINLEPDLLRTFSLQKMNIQGTPTILMFDEGKLKNIWTGVLSPNDQKILLNSVL